MTPKKIRIVGYVPPQSYQKLRDYIKANDISESGALARIVKAFFEGSVSSNSDLEARLERELAFLRAEMKDEMTQMQQRLGVLEAALQRKSRSYPPSRNSWND